MRSSFRKPLRLAAITLFVVSLLDSAVAAPGPRVASDPATGACPAKPAGVCFADWIVSSWPNIDAVTGKGWEYTNGIILQGMAAVYEKTGDPKYLDYIRRFVDSNINQEGSVSLGSDHNIDRIQPANLLLFLYEQTKDEKYRKAAAGVRAAFAKFPKTAEGGFWHKTRYPTEMWADGIYMAEPFVVRYAADFPPDGEAFDIAAFQVALIGEHALDPSTGLVRHAWDSDRNALWADKTTGLSPEVWSRGMGWYAMALVDILRYLPGDHPGTPRLRALFQQVAKGIKDTQDPATGLWFQVLNKGKLADNWHETSGSGMFVYAIKTGVDRGYLDSSYLEVANRGWAGMKSKIKTTSDGSPVITDSVEGMGVQPDYAGYVGKRRVENLPHGLCAVMLASSVMDDFKR